MTATVTTAADDSWATMPVDSTTRTCCGGIGDHTQECVPLPPGSISADPWHYQDGNMRHINFPIAEIAAVEGGTLSVEVSCFQRKDGTLADVGVWIGEGYFLTPDALTGFSAAYGVAADVVSRLTQEAIPSRSPNPLEGVQL